MERKIGPLLRSSDSPCLGPLLQDRDVANRGLTSGIAGRPILVPGQFLDLTQQGVSEGGPKAFPPGDLHVKRNVITLFESLQGNVVKWID